MPDGLRLPFRRVTTGAPEVTGAVFEPSGGIGAGPFAGSRVSWTGSGWELRTRTGTVLGFGRTGSPLRLSWIREPGGRTARFVRAPDGDDGSPDGELRGTISEDGQWVRFTHDGAHRITSATDQVGDVVSYRYARPAGVPADLLVAASYRPAAGRTTTVGYRYQALTGRLLALTDGRRDLIRVAYDEAGRVVRQVVPARSGAPVREWRYSYDVRKRRVSIPGRAGTVTLPQVRRVVVVGPDGRRMVRFARGRVAERHHNGPHAQPRRHRSWSRPDVCLPRRQAASGRDPRPRRCRQPGPVRPLRPARRHRGPGRLHDADRLHRARGRGFRDRPCRHYALRLERPRPAGLRDGPSRRSSAMALRPGRATRVVHGRPRGPVHLRVRPVGSVGAGALRRTTRPAAPRAGRLRVRPIGSAGTHPRLHGRRSPLVPLRQARERHRRDRSGRYDSACV